MANRSVCFGVGGLSAMLLLVAGAGCGGPAKCADGVWGYINDIVPESLCARAERHQVVAQRRGGVPIIVHRGASRVAPENTLEAYAAAMDLGADGVEIDIRRSTDGVLYLYHDNDLERLTTGNGKVDELSYYELLMITPKDVYGPATAETRPPTLAAFLVLARQRVMLLHLDIKEPGLQDEIARIFDEADVWDHVVSINDYNSDKLRARADVKQIGYAGWVPDGEDEGEIPEFLNNAQKHGQMAICKDPRSAGRVLGREPGSLRPIPGGLRACWGDSGLVGVGCEP